MSETALSRLVAELRRVALLGSCEAVLGWDEQTYLPPAGGEHRADQLSLLAGMRHEMATAPKVGELIAANLVTMLLIKRHIVDAGQALSRDVIFVANSDEEAGGDYGMGWLVANHRELIDAEFVLNEGGRTRIVQGKPLYVAVQNTEKVSHVVTMTARGPGGHASVPLEDMLARP